MVRYTVKPEHVEENEELVRAVYAELDRRTTAGVRYATYRIGDSGSFVHVSSSLEERSPLADLDAFREFQREISQRCSEQPVVVELHEVGSYSGLEPAGSSSGRGGTTEPAV
ncbi:MAG TPA: hypothetical protein VGF46_01620 [Gaiellales bacterium]|jgi:hypothetical protein